MEIVARKAGGREEPLTWADTQKMKLLWRVVQETMRLSPPVELGFRVMLDDIVFDGFTIPKSWQVSPKPQTLNPKHPKL
jgi:cytochrome P450